jgi:anthranilate phosphoribosyltransferase
MNYTDAKVAFEALFSEKMSEDEAKEFLVELYNRGESSEEILAAAEVMRANSIKLNISQSIRDKLIDNCGTGGDKSGSFNVSTTVSMVLASCGCFVAKHGNRSITSKSGSADMLEALGAKLSMPNEQKVKMLEDIGFAFLFATEHHPAMKHIMPIRKSLSHRSIFNILGPLTNPADVGHHLIGVFDYIFAPKMAEALRKMGSKKGFIVTSKDGMDEVSVCAPTNAVYFDESVQKELEIDPNDYGIKFHNPNEIQGGDAIQNARITYELLKNPTKDAKHDIVLINASLALVSSDIARDIKEGIEIANESILSKKAFSKLQQIIEVSNKL